MIKDLRQRYNDNFTNEAYRAMMDWMEGQYSERPRFAVAETPVFLDNRVRDHVLQACRDVLAVLRQPDFAERARPAIPPGEEVPGQTARPMFFQLDFGLCEGPDGEIIPQMVEGQGFPSLYFFQHLLNQSYRHFFAIPEGWTGRFNTFTDDEYLDLLRDCVLGGHQNENVVLLEVDPNSQKTRIDFTVCCAELGIQEVCISDVELAGDQLYYKLKGKRTPIHRIFNRVIFDELKTRPELRKSFTMVEHANVEWAGHPNWFFLLSKHTLPLINSPYVPKSHFLNRVEELPTDLENYVLKPLYSFAGMGVNLRPTPEDLAAITAPEHYVLQRKVQYADLVATPDGPARVELRMMFVWPPDQDEPILLNNLVRLSKGEMIGVRYNEGKTWVGGSMAYFEPLEDVSLLPNN